MTNHRLLLGPVIAERVPLHNSVLADQAGERTYGERAAAEAEQEDLVTGLVVCGEESVGFFDVAREPPTEGAAKEAPRPETLRSYAVVVVSKLFRICLMPGDRVENTPDVRAAGLSSSVASTVGANHDVFGHRGEVSLQAVPRVANRRMNCSTEAATVSQKIAVRGRPVNGSPNRTIVNGSIVAPWRLACELVLVTHRYHSVIALATSFLFDRSLAS